MNITADRSLGTLVSQAGQVATIDGGTILGANQFHSFDRFDVGTRETARFIGPSSIDHILSRVTGGHQSMIDGTLRSDIPGAKLYLLNPSGVMFGPNARLSIQGSFYVSTADTVRLEDGGVFTADLDTESVLSVADPVAFRFLSENPSSIRIEESLLAVPSGQTLFIVGGDIDIVGGPRGELLAQGGQIHLVAMASPGDVSGGFSEHESRDEVQPAAANGTITLSDFALLNVRGDVGGSLWIRGGEVSIEGSVLIADTLFGVSSRNPSGITIHATETVTLSGGSRLVSNTVGPSAAGDVTIVARNLVLRDGGVISSATVGSGPGGQITIRASDTVTVTGSNPTNGVPTSIGTPTIRTSSGAAGNILIEAPRVMIAEGGQVIAVTLGTGRGGDITLRVSDTLTITGSNAFNSLIPSGVFTQAQGTALGSGSAGDVLIEAATLTITQGGQINSGTLGTGQGGNITIRSSDTVIVTGSDPIDHSASGIVAQSEPNSSGSAGDVRVEASRLRLAGGGQIRAVTFGSGQGGNVTVRVSDTITITGSSSVDGFSSGFSAQAGLGSSGPAGDILVETPRLMLTEGGRIGSGTFGPGQGGNVIVRVSDTVTISGVNPVDGSSSALLSESGEGASGQAGSVLIEGPRLRLAAGGQISVSTFGMGEGGDATVRMSDQVTITGSHPADGAPSGILASAIGTVPGSGSAGDVVIEGPELIIANGGIINVSTSGPGRGGRAIIRIRDTLTITGVNPVTRFASGLFAQANENSTGPAGDILIEADVLRIAEGGQISSSTFAAGEGSNVTIRVRDTLTITGLGSEGLLTGIFVNTFDRGEGGDITINARKSDLADGAQIQAVSTGAGNAGNIMLTVQDTFRSDNSAIRTDAFEADGGNIEIRAGNLIHLRNSEVAARVGGGEFTVGGNIAITPALAVLQNSRVVADAEAGQGGNIQITAQEVVLIDALSVLDASSDLGINGIVDVQAPVTDLSNAVMPLHQPFAVASTLLQSHCANRIRGEGVARFALTGRDRIPTEPGRILPSPQLLSNTSARQPSRHRSRDHAWQIMPAFILAEQRHNCMR